MNTLTATAALPSDVPPEALFQTLLAIAPIGIALLRPLYAEGAAEATPIVDFALVQLSPVARQMLGGLPERPTESLLALVPFEHEVGGFAFYRQAFLSGEVARHQQLYQADGVDGYYQVVAQRQGPLLLVTFTDTNEQPRSAVEQALRDSQARERAALAEAEAQRQLLFQTLNQLPAAVAVHEGPAHVLTFYNSRHAELAGRPLALGRPAAEFYPELVGQAFFAVPDQVYATGEPVELVEAPAQLRHPATGEVSQHYFTLRYAPRRDAAGHVIGLLATATSVTEQVLARQQVQRLNEELTATNDALRTSNLEYQRANTALGDMQRQLQQLNQELEARVQQRTQEAVALQAELLAAAQRQVHAREELYQVFEQAPVVVALLREPEHLFHYCNPAFQALFPERALVGRRYAEAMPEIVAAGLLPELDRVYATGQTYAGTALPVVVSPPGGGAPHQRYYDFSYQPYRENGRIVGVSIFAHDVTEQVQAHRQVEQLNAKLEARVQARTQQLREAQAATERERAQLQALLTQAPMAIALFQGEDLRVATVNTEMAALWGYATEQVLGRPLLAGVPELRGQGFDDLLRQVLHTRVPITGREVPAELRRANQVQTSYYNFVYQPLYDADGQVAGVIDVAMDVTEQVLARQQLQQLNAELETRVQERTQEAQTARAQTELQKQRLEQLFRQAPAAICILDGPDLVFELVNTLYQELFSGRPLLGLPILTALPELTDQVVWHRLQHVYRTGLEHQDLGLHVPLTRTAGGPLEDFYFNCVFQPRYNAAGLVDGVVVFCFEVTEQVLARQQVLALNEQLTTANAELTRTNVDLDTFVYIASHDLKAPITNIEGLLAALRYELPAAVQEEEMTSQLLGMIQGAVERFRTTIDQLTDVSRMQHAQNQPAEQVLLAAVVEDVRLDLEPLLSSTHAQLTVEVAPDLTVHFAPKNLRSVVVNLLSNACKYHRPGLPPVVRLRAVRQAQQVVLTVADNGLGMSEAQLRQLFGLFQRLHTHVEGSGVGLYMVKRLLENAGGTIAVQSQLEQGTTFTVTFPG